MAVQIKGVGGGGATKVLNGVLEQYYAYSDTINAVSFVEFLTDSVVSAQCTGTDSSGYNYCRGCVLSDNKVLMCSWNSSSNNIYLVVATFDNSSISFGTVCTAEHTSYAYDIEVQKLSDTTALLGYSTGSNGYYRMYVVTINNTTITVGARYVTEGYIFDYNFYGEPTRICVLNSTKALITYIRNSSTSSYDGICYTCAIVCTISGTTITFGTELVISSKDSYSTYDQYRSAQYNALVSSTQVLSCMDFYDGNNFKKYFHLFSISGTTVTITSSITNTTTISVSTIGNIFKKITAAKFLLIYFKANEAPYARIITLSGTTISIGDETAIKYNWTSNTQIALLIYDTTTAYLYTCYGSGGRINRTPIYISGTTITSGDAVAVGDTKLDRPYFAARAGDLEIVTGRELMSIMLLRTGTYLKSSESKIDGLLVSKATSNSKGKVYKLG